MLGSIAILPKTHNLFTILWQRKQFRATFLLWLLEIADKKRVKL